MSVRQMHQPTTTAKPKLLTQVRETIRRKHYSVRTEEAYVDGVKRYIFHKTTARPLPQAVPTRPRPARYRRRY